MSEEFVLAVNPNGEKQYVPRNFISMTEAGVPGFNFRLAPSAKAEEEQAAAEAEPETPPTPATTKATTTKESKNA